MSRNGSETRRILWALLITVLAALAMGQVAAAQELRGVVGKDREHVVAPGEDLYHLAVGFGLALEHLAFANGLGTSSTWVAAGTHLRVPGRRVLPGNPPAEGLVVNLPERGVFLFRQGRFKKFFPLAIGQPGGFATPQGSFTLTSRVVNPTWLPPEWAGLGEIAVPAGPGNPLGDRWMGLSLPGIGFHSTTSPMSIGQAVSHGCMRMYPASAQELFEEVRVGMPVRIEYETAKVGYDPQTGEFCLAAFPDVYGQADPRWQAAQALEEVGLAGLWSDSDLDRRSRPTGVARPILQADAQIKVAGIPLDMEFPALLLGDTLWASSELPRALGLEVSWDGRSRQVEVRRAGRVLSLRVGSQEVLPSPAPPRGEKVGEFEGSWHYQGTARMVGGRALLPVRLLLDTFAIPFRWEASERVLEIEG
ncbi:MAG: L,D-transpeptidase family protein [Candidatus Xenobium sp.]|jgi:L,D-transpeptidase ErfK/SrfK|nr:L,D-transpeptidase family protein [Burkholderiales bacterium]